MSVRIQGRDERVGKHLARVKRLTTEQIAKLEFSGKVGAARRRLYDLKKGEVVFSLGSLEGSTKEEKRSGTKVVWGLTEPYFRAHEEARDDDRHPERRKYPGRLKTFDLKHLIATNDVYVALAPLLTAENVPGLYYPEDWRWISEPYCWRSYETRFGSFVLKPDAEIEVFGVAFLLERQTAEARKKPEAIHDKVFGHHRYENSSHRKDDPRTLVQIWACDAERDVRAVKQAATCHPTKTARQLRMDDLDTRRTAVLAGTPARVVDTVRYAAANYGEIPQNWKASHVRTTREGA